jgi:TonB family protein
VTTLLESNARPFGSSKGAALSMLVHGGLIAAAVVGTASVALPPREKIEEHPILYVTPPPPKVYVAPERLPEPKRAPPSKAPRTAPPPPKAPPPRQMAAPSPQPQRVTVPVIAPIKVPVSLPPVDLKAVPTVSDAELARAADAVTRSRGAKSSGDGDVDSRSGSKGGLGSGDPGRAYNENQVDRAVQMTRAATPRYPDALRSVSVQGEVQVRYIVDARGRVEPGSIQVISTTHKLFADAVRAALLESRFRPAEAGGHPVRQLVEQPFIFKLQ